MNKIILLSLVILFAICSRSWAGEYPSSVLKSISELNFNHEFKVSKINMIDYEIGKVERLLK